MLRSYADCLLGQAPLKCWKRHRPTNKGSYCKGINGMQIIIRTQDAAQEGIKVLLADFYRFGFTSLCLRTLSIASKFWKYNNNVKDK